MTQTVTVEQEVIGFKVFSTGTWPEGMTLSMTLTREQAEELVQVVVGQLMRLHYRKKDGEGLYNKEAGDGGTHRSDSGPGSSVPSPVPGSTAFVV